MLTGILIFIAGIFVMIFVHELGHFLTAKRFGIKVEEFFIGFGPRLWSFRRGETEYGIKAIPVGGYVRIAGMNPLEEPSPEDRERLFTSKPKWQRAIVLAAGAFTHFVLAFLLLGALVWVVGVPGDRPAVGAVLEEIAGQPSPATQAGLRPGDVFIELDGRPVRYDTIGDYLTEHAGDQMQMVVRRGEELVTLEATPVTTTVEGQPRGRLGILIDRESVRLGPLEGLSTVGSSLGRMVVGSFEGMGRAFGPEGIGRIGDALFSGQERTINDPVGVVGVGRVAGQLVQAGLFGAILEMFAFFNVFVGILNILPLPPLDGGHLAVLGFEAVTGRKVNPRSLIPVAAAVAGFLILMTISLLYLDVVSPIPNPFQ
jgi:membrane-associated protease RseP (regulator of RpoE activity)